MNETTIFLCGDVMTGRGIDQILPHPSKPKLYEPLVKDAREYAALAEALNGPIAKPVDYSYIWGDALSVLQREKPDVRIVNLETSITTSDDYLLSKEIHYRMHPQNVPCLQALGANCCVLANNHALDWGEKGLIETIETLKKAKIKMVGAGRNDDEAAAPAVINLSKGKRVIVFAYGHASSGALIEWKAGRNKLGINVLTDLSLKTTSEIREKVRSIKKKGDIAIFSIHWGSNWGYEIPEEQRLFAHNLIDKAAIDIVHGHSSHHVKGIEVYRGKPIFYGCGDFINDYEGISGFESFRDDLVLMYFVKVNASNGVMVSLIMVPLQIRRFHLNRASRQDTKWLLNVLNREGHKLGTRFAQAANGTTREREIIVSFLK